MIDESLGVSSAALLKALLCDMWLQYAADVSDPYAFLADVVFKRLVLCCKAGTRVLLMSPCAAGSQAIRVVYIDNNSWKI